MVELFESTFDASGLSSSVLGQKQHSSHQNPADQKHRWQSVNPGLVQSSMATLVLLIRLFVLVTDEFPDTTLLIYPCLGQAQGAYWIRTPHGWSRSLRHIS